MHLNSSLLKIGLWPNRYGQDRPSPEGFRVWDGREQNAKEKEK